MEQCAFAEQKWCATLPNVVRRLADFGIPRPDDGRQSELPVVLPHSEMLPNKVCSDLSLFTVPAGMRSGEGDGT